MYDDIWAIRQYESDVLQAALRLQSQEAIQAKYDEFQQENALDADDPFRRSSLTYAVSGSEAVIGVTGVLTKTPDFFARWLGLGNTTYASIIAATGRAEADANVKSIRYVIESPGGNIQGMFEAANVIAQAAKPTVVTFQDVGASAAYVLGSQADRVTANNDAAVIGSIGVVTTRYLSNFVKNITSTAAPKKAPDASTRQGEDDIRAHLDEIHAKMAAVIASGRNTTIEKVNSDFGQGGVLLADKALAAGMIDGIDLYVTKSGTGIADSASASSTAQPTVPAQPAIPQNNPRTGGKKMDLATLKAEHPDLCAQLIAEGRKAGVTEGATQERERVTAHLTMGKSAGAMDFAVKCISEGKGFGPSEQAEYLSARLNKQDADAREKDNPPAAAPPASSADEDPTGASTKAEDDALLQATLAASKQPITAKDGKCNAHVAFPAAAIAKTKEDVHG